MTHVRFKDFYGQYVSVNDQTASGNIRIKVNTHTDLNKVKIVPEAELDIETDISLDERQTRFLLSTLQMIVDGWEENE